MSYPNFSIDTFIGKKITGRDLSLLTADLRANESQLREKIAGKTALVIGGAGTIGSSYIRALLKFPLKRLFVVDTNENGLTELIRDIRSRNDLHIPEEIKTYPMNFGDPVFRKMFVQEGPFHIVANFAAHKHVRSEKDPYSIEAMIENNVLKAKTFLDLLFEYPPERFFCVSTDKAANPVNIMGASKKLMEDVIMAYSTRLHITTARFANVAFSNGSLLQGFLERQAKQQPWSCPLGIRRYFVSPEESGQICLMASMMGESGDIFFPKLNMEKDLVAFSDIATDLLEWQGFTPLHCKTEAEAREKMADFHMRPGDEFPVYFFASDTTGEKAYEEFYTDSEQLQLDRFEQLGVIKNQQNRNVDDLEKLLSDMRMLFQSEVITKADIVGVLKNYLPNFSHVEKGVNLDQRM